MSQKPYIFLAFANDKENQGAGYLKELEQENQQLNDLFDNCEWCLARTRTEATYKRINNVLHDFKNKIKIFHFAGHANSKALWLGDKERALVKGMALTLGENGIKLAFLNGCSTEEQIEAFHGAGIPVVIATTRPVADKVARSFAVYFYEALCKGYSLKDSFVQAENALLTQFEADEMYSVRGFMREDSEEDRAHPYRFAVDHRFEAVAEESLLDWQEEKKAQELIEETLASVGPKSYLLCNRKRQTNKFEHPFRETGAKDNGLRKPHVFVIHGPEDEMPPSLAERHRLYEVDRLCESYGLPAKRKQVITLDLPSARELEGGDLEYGLDFLKESLAQELRLPNRGLTAQAVLKRVAPRRDLIFFNHILPPGTWHEQHCALLSAYLTQFWALTLQAKDPQIILVFQIEEEKIEGLQKFWKKTDEVAKKLKASLPSDTHCVLLPRLEAVLKEDVLRWQRRFLPEETDLVDQLFGRKKELPMKVIQKALKQAVDFKLNTAKTQRLSA